MQAHKQELFLMKKCYILAVPNGAGKTDHFQRYAKQRPQRFGPGNRYHPEHGKQPLSGR
jgi:hypothetical protein